MDVERLRAFLLTLPHVVETLQWGENLVFWTGDKAIDGKMFALINLDETHQQHSATNNQPLLLSYSAGPTRYSELVEIEGIVPAPYMARIQWVAVERWNIFTTAEWHRELRAAYDLTLAKLPKKVLLTLALPAAKQKAFIAARRKIIAANLPKK